MGCIKIADWLYLAHRLAKIRIGGKKEGKGGGGKEELNEIKRRKECLCFFWVQQ